ncbi:MAG: GH116 family glycosyl-hydrolase, partial [Planctomycetota bacterium]
MKRSIILSGCLVSGCLLSSAPTAAPDPVPSAIPPFVPVVDLGLDAVMQRLEKGSDGKTPVVKQFEHAWVKSLFERGEPCVYTKQNSANFDYIGMPAGGIGAGTVYLGGDGTLWHWDIFNTRRPTAGVQAYRSPPRRNSPLLAGFAIRATGGGKSRVRTLDRHGFADVEFLGQYPIGYVVYRDAESPVVVSLEAFSPF